MKFPGPFLQCPVPGRRHRHGGRHGGGGPGRPAPAAASLPVGTRGQAESESRCHWQPESRRPAVTVARALRGSDHQHIMTHDDVTQWQPGPSGLAD